MPLPPAARSAARVYVDDATGCLMSRVSAIGIDLDDFESTQRAPSWQAELEHALELLQQPPLGRAPAAVAPPREPLVLYQAQRRARRAAGTSYFSASPHDSALKLPGFTDASVWLAALLASPKAAGERGGEIRARLGARSSTPVALQTHTPWTQRRRRTGPGAFHGDHAGT